MDHLRDMNDIESEGMVNDEKQLERNGSSFSDRSPGATIRQPLLTKSRMNNTSQIAIVGANVCPIESLDYDFWLPRNGKRKEKDMIL